MPVEVLIVGAGAIGAFYGSRIALNPSINVSCICRSNYKAVKSSGFTISSPQYGEYQWTPTRTFSSPAEAREANITWDFLVITTKALPDVTDDTQLIEGLVSPNSAIVLIQNGLGVEEPYTKRFPLATVLSAVTIASAAQPKPGHIKHNRWTRINVGPFLDDDSGSSSSGEDKTKTKESRTQTKIQQNQQFVDLLTQGGQIKDATAYSHARLQLTRWHKLAINASMNPTSVLTGCTPNSTMSADPLLSKHLQAVMDEILTTAPLIIGQPFPADFATSEKILASTRRNTSGSVPSMAIDWQEGKPLELEVILGNAIRIANGKGYSMPRLESLYAILKMAVRRRDEELDGRQQRQTQKVTDGNGSKL